nr:uncharacterized protein LOC108067068 [Drosophila takahashii]
MNRYFWLSIFILILTEGGISFKLTTPMFPLENIQCVDCEKVNENCEIDEIGFHCESPDDANAIAYNESKILPEHLLKCVPKGHYFTEITSVHKTCCFWSPGLGCQAVTSNHKQPECSKCVVEVTSGQVFPEGCPCKSKKSSLKSSNGQKSLWNRPSPLLLIIVTFYYFFSSRL